MGKSNNGRSTSRNSSRNTSNKRRSNTNRLTAINTEDIDNGRPKPMTPGAGYTRTRRRYEDGGYCW